MVHVQDFENADFRKESELIHGVRNAAGVIVGLQNAIDDLRKKVDKKLSTDEIIAIINLLRGSGANSDIVDAVGNRLDYYINTVQLITENERKALLRALGLPDAGRVIRYNDKDLPLAIEKLKALDEIVDAGHKIQTIIWTIDAAQGTRDSQRKYDILRLAMALLAKLKEDTKESIKNPALFASVERSINDIRLIVRDAALIVSGKVTLAEVHPIQAVPVIGAAAHRYRW